MQTPDRAAVLDAAVTLFYSKGFNNIAIDDIELAVGGQGNTVELYFDSKESLIIAALAWRDERFRADLASYVSTSATTPADRLLSTFDFLSDWYGGSGFHGCMFINACVQYPDKNELINQAAAQHKQALYDYLRELALEACTSDHEALSQQLVLLMEGAIVTTQVTGRVDVANQARRAAEILLAHTNS